MYNVARFPPSAAGHLSMGSFFFLSFFSFRLISYRHFFPVIPPQISFCFPSPFICFLFPNLSTSVLLFPWINYSHLFSGFPVRVSSPPASPSVYPLVSFFHSLHLASIAWLVGEMEGLIYWLDAAAEAAAFLARRPREDLEEVVGISAAP